MRNESVNLHAELLKESYKTPLVLDFWAEWCGPCRTLSPVLEKLAAEAAGKWRLVKINVDENPAISQQYQVQSIPTVVLLSEGQLQSQFQGALPEYQVKKWLEENLPTENRKLLESAKRAISNGEMELAKGIFGEIMKTEPENDEARGLYAILVFKQDLAKAAELVQPIPEESPFFDKATSIKTLARLRFELDSIKSLAAKSDDSKAAWQSYLAGIEAFNKNNYADALKAWIEAIQLNREPDDDGARKACAALFNLLGHDHELTRKFHRRFSMALY